MKMKDHVRAKLLLPLLTLAFCFAAGQTRAQSVPVTLKVSDAPLEQVLNAIEKQTSYLFVYDKSVDVARKVSLTAANEPLKNVLDRLARMANVGYAVENTSIVLSQKNAPAEEQKSVTVTGKVVDKAGLPIIGAAVVVKDTTIGTSTDIDGKYSLQVPPPRSVGRPDC